MLRLPQLTLDDAEQVNLAFKLTETSSIFLIIKLNFVIRNIFIMISRSKGYTRMHGRDENCTDYSCRKNLSKSPPARHRRKWKDSKTYLRQVCESVDSIFVAVDRNQWLALMTTAMNQRESQNVRNFVTS